MAPPSQCQQAAPSMQVRARLSSARFTSAARPPLAAFSPTQERHGLSFMALTICGLRRAGDRDLVHLPPERARFIDFIGRGRVDSNPPRCHCLRILSPVCLPIPPRSPRSGAALRRAAAYWRLRSRGALQGTSSRYLPVRLRAYSTEGAQRKVATFCAWGQSQIAVTLQAWSPASRCAVS